jgi:hypothetical protein
MNSPHLLKWVQGIYKDSSLLGTYQSEPPSISPPYSSQVCTITYVVVKPSSPSSVLKLSFKNDQLPPMLTISYPLTEIPFFYPPPRVTLYQMITTLTLSNLVLGKLVWYLKPPSMVPIPTPHLKFL